jgi:hypothetical protein
MLFPLALILIVIISSVMLWRQFSTHALASSDAPDDAAAAAAETAPDIAKAA